MSRACAMARRLDSVARCRDRPRSRATRQWILLTASALALCLPLKTAKAVQDARPTVAVAEYDGIIHPIAAEFFDDVLTHADASGAAAIVMVLRTPGGL